MSRLSRRSFLHAGTASIAAAALGRRAFAATPPGSGMKFGLVTYLWGQHWDLPTLIAHCEKTKVLGVELRTTHKHGVERELTAAARAEVKKRFEDSPVVHVGIGSNESFDHPIEIKLKQAIEATKEFIKLSHDTGGSGVKVKPNNLHPNIPHEQTIAQIGKALNELGAFGADYGQEIRLEVHGKCSPLPIIKQIMDVADHPNVGVCWNSNDVDLEGEGLVHNFNLVKDRFGATAHVRELNIGPYPYQELMNLFVEMDYDGWILLEARTDPKDPIAALNEQREVWEAMIAKGQEMCAKG